MERSFFDYLNESKNDNEQQAKNAENERDRDIKQARRERYIAIFGDLAKLAAQSYAKAGGAWNIKEFKPFTKTSNDYIRTLRKQHKEQRIKELNEQKKLNYTITKAAYDSETKNKQFEQRQQQQQNQFEQRQQQQQKQFEQRLDNEKNKPTSNNSGTIYLYDAESGTKKPYSDIFKAYAALPKEFKAKKQQAIAGGDIVTIEIYNPTKDDMRRCIEEYNAQTETTSATPDEEKIIENEESPTKQVQQDNTIEKQIRPSKATIINGVRTYKKI